MTTRSAHYQELERTWAGRSGLPGFLTAVNHKQVGRRFVWTAVAFLLIGGVEALLLRLQLAQPENTVLGPDAYNQAFTMHGTTMMFLFAVPILEGLAMYLVPLQVGSRDMPLPRLNAFGYWMYLFGGLLLHWSFLTGEIPDGGWFAYTPLTTTDFSPGMGIDFWLLGVTLLEVSGIIGAVELVVIILRFRAPGMSLARIPLFTWSSLFMAGMILVAFPFVLTASTLLEIERKTGAPFYDPAGGGDPLLWQHLFWIFGHPEVYIMLLPATGIVSAVVAAHVRRPIVAYPLVVAALAGIAIASFGLWVHHMFTVGLPVLALSLFAVASFFIAVPSGIQVFAWIATIWEGKPRWQTPLWFVAGFVFIFVLGGITGVMVATAPFDAQAHDSFFVVAHFHYVLIGGVVFPIFAGLHHWFPKMAGRMPSERAGKTAFWLMFAGFNITFFPQHWLGLQGMVRRTYTYADGLGWGAANLVSTIGAFILAAGIAVFLANLAHAWRRGPEAGADPWGADTLEWAAESPPSNHNFDEAPRVGSLSPLWDEADPGFDDRTVEHLSVVDRPWRGRRELIRTTVVDAEPEAIVVIPGPTYWPFVTAVFLATSVVGVLVDSWALALVAGGLGLGCLIGWLGEDRLQLTRQSPDASASPPEVLAAVGTAGDRGVDIGGADEEPAEERRRAARHLAEGRTGGHSASWWGAMVGMVAVGTVIAALVYSYYYLRLGVGAWPPEGTPERGLVLPVTAAGLAAAALAFGAILPRSTVVRMLGWALGVAVVTTQLVALTGSGYRIGATSYEAIVIVLEVAAAVVLGSALVFRTGALVAGMRGPHDPEPVEVDAGVWKVALVLWLLVWVVVHLSPGVI